MKRDVVNSSLLRPNWFRIGVMHMDRKSLWETYEEKRDISNSTDF